MENHFLLTAINAKYIHSNLAVRYIKQYCKRDIEKISMIEFSINDSLSHIFKEILQSKANIIAFSCYIWNVEMVLKLCSSLKKANPKLKIILGGPEVSFDAFDMMKKHAAVDYIILGEGEETFLELAKQLNNEEIDIDQVKGIAYRDQDTIKLTQERDLIQALDDIPFPYEAVDDLSNKIIYYETNRGCPFNCQYCLSSTIAGVRHFSMERIKQDIHFFVTHQVRQVKLVDRTFNSDRKRCIEIIEYIIGLDGHTNFHFEIAADLINDAFLDAFKKAPAGLFQLEIGVQSTHVETLKAIQRTTNFSLVSENIRKLLSFNNAHIHLDLIAGLPYEDLNCFKKSFNDVYDLMPDMLQLGFLKLLKGSGLRQQMDLYRIECHDFAPYEVISTQWLSHEALFRLKEIEHLVEVYYNSGKFKNTLNYIMTHYYSMPFSFFEELAAYWRDHKAFDMSKGVNDLYILLYEFMAETFSAALEFNEWMKLDWLLYCRSGNMPPIIKRYDHTSIKEKVHAFIKAPENRHLFSMESLTAKELLKRIDYEVFFMDVTMSPPIEKEVLMFFIPKTTQFKKDTSYFSITLL